MMTFQFCETINSGTLTHMHKDMINCSKCEKLRDNLDIADWDKVICVYCELEDADWNDPLSWLPLPNFKHSEMTVKDIKKERKFL
jgi:hypothetical protein